MTLNIDCDKFKNLEIKYACIVEIDTIIMDNSDSERW